MPAPDGRRDTAESSADRSGSGRPGAGAAASAATVGTPIGLARVLVPALLALALLVALPVTWVRADGAAPPALPAPQPTVALPEQMDLAVEYQGQTLCDSTPKPGAVALKDLLLRTYGTSTVWIPRACDQGGQSEHKEGRALDWMVGAKPSALRSAADAFVAWVTAPDAAGVPGAMARRMGIMYIGWDDKIWRAYDTGRGWAELKGCFSTPSSGYDTYCHRDHVHISMTWDGAAGLTSFWDGSPTTVAACERRTSAVAVGALGSADDPAVVLNTAKGKGVASGTPCRLSADRWSGDGRRISVALPMGGQAATVSLRVARYASNAPGTLRLSSTSGDTATVKAGAALPADVTLDVAADGVVTAAVDAGSASVKLVSFGTGSAPTPAPAPAPTPDPPPAPAPAPAVTSLVSLSGPSYVRAGSPITLSGTVTDPPAGAVVKRLLKRGGSWVPVGKKATVTDGAWTATRTAAQPALLRYRAALYVDGAEVARSPRRDVRVLPTNADLVKRPIVTLDGASYVPAGGTLTLSGRVQSPPAGAAVQRLLKLRGQWQPLGDPVPVVDGAWTMDVSVPPPPRTLRYRAALLVNGQRTTVSPVADVRVIKSR